MTAVESTAEIRIFKNKESAKNAKDAKKTNESFIVILSEVEGSCSKHGAQAFKILR